MGRNVVEFTVCNVETTAAKSVKTKDEISITLLPGGILKVLTGAGSPLGEVPSDSYSSIPRQACKGSIRSIRRSSPGGEVQQILVRLHEVQIGTTPRHISKAEKILQEDFVPRTLEKERLKLLADSENIKDLLRDRRLQELIKSIDQDEDREQVLQGPSVTAADEKASTSQTAEGKDSKVAKDVVANTPENAPVFNFWGVANALADSVKKTTADISASVGETDWRAELEAFSKGVREDATEVQRHAQKAAKDGASRLESLPQQAANAQFPRVDPDRLKTQFDQVGSKIGRLSTKVLTGSKDLFEQVVEAVQTELDSIEGQVRKPRTTKQSLAKRQAQMDGPKYSRLEADISAMQRSSSTYCDQPEDGPDFGAWLKEFDLKGKAEDIDAIIRENTFMAELQSRIVPLIVQYDVFWTRYFYQLHKLKQKHEQMQSVVQRAAMPATEQVSWDDDEGDTPEETNDEETSAGPKERMGRDKSSAKPAHVSEDAGPARAKLPGASKGEDEPDTSTASDESGNGPWTVVTSPTHKRTDSVEASSPVPEEPLEPTDALKEPTETKTTSATLQGSVPDTAEGGEGGQEDESDIDVSDEEGIAPSGEPKSDVEEDWGLWD